MTLSCTVIPAYFALPAQIPGGGYFVRQQDGELKYMVVFNSPQVNQ